MYKFNFRAISFDLVFFLSRRLNTALIRDIISPLIQEENLTAGSGNA